MTYQDLFSPLLLLFTLLSVRHCWAAAAGGPRASSRVNLLFMVADDLGATDVGWRGAEYPTPNIDALAYAGVRLENYYVQLVCSPSRTAFMTGRYPLHTGFNHIVIWQDVDAAIDHAHPTVAEVLRDRHGYNTSYLIGKWHNGHAAWNNTPPGRGFEGGWYGWNGGSSDYYTHMIAPQAPRHSTDVPAGFAMYDGLGSRAGRPNPAMGPPAALPTPAWNGKGNYSTELWADVAIDLIRGHNFARDPFFMYLAFQAPHAPVQSCPDEAINAACRGLTAGAGRDVYCSMVTYMDRKIGEVVAALRSRGELERTLIIFTSDNGGCMPVENRGCNWPLRGGKHHLFEGGVQVTGFVSGGLVPAAARGSTSHALMHATDWFSTILGVLEAQRALPTRSQRPQRPRPRAGASYGTEEEDEVHLWWGDGPVAVDGFDLWPALTNISNLNTSTIDPEVTFSPRTEIPHNVDPLLRATGMPSEPQGALRLGTYKLVVGDLDVGWLRCNMTLERPTASQGTGGALNGTFLLFDLLTDPYERTDLSTSPEPTHQAALARLLARWEYWKGEAVQPNYPDSDPRSYPLHFRGTYNGSWAPWLDLRRPY